MRDKAMKGWSGDASARLECEVKTYMTTDLTAFHVLVYGHGRVMIGQSSWEGLSMGRHEMAFVRCPFCRWSALHGGPCCCRCWHSCYNSTNLQRIFHKRASAV